MLPGLVAATDPPSGDRGKQIGPLGRAILADRIGVEGGNVGILDRRCIAVAPVPTICNADAGRDGAPPAVCHSFVVDGRMQMLGDCTHALAGQKVDIPPWPQAAD
mgnify:CR=1 FL=1